MTVIYGIQIDEINYKFDEIKYAILNNDPIENKLNVIVVLSNPCLYARRYLLFKEFVKRIENDNNINLFVVEMIYKNQRFIITDKNNANNLQIKTEIPIWHKENMINLAVKYLLPKNYKAFAWIDSDFEFESNTWSFDTLKILNGCKDVVQLFSHCKDMDKEYNSMSVFNSFGYCFSKNKKFASKGLNYWHPGYAWAISRKAYEKISGLYDKGILGSGDSIMALSFINKVNTMINENYNKDYINSMLEFQKKSNNLRLGYVPGVIRHHYHGSKKNRKYTERWQILIKHNYSPILHLKYNNESVLIPNENFSEKFKNDIMKYFGERKEDE